MPQDPVRMAIEKLTRRVLELERLAERQKVLERVAVVPVGTWLRTPALRGFWTLVNSDENGDVYDLSGHGRTLTNNNSIVITLPSGSLLGYAAFTAASSMYFSRVDEPGLESVSAFHVAGWFYFDALGSKEGLMSKWEEAGNQRGWQLYKTAGDVITLDVTSDGTAGTITTVTSSATIAAATWYFISGAFSGSSVLEINVGRQVDQNTTSIPATIHNSTEAFNIGRTNQANYLDGRAAMCSFAGAAIHTTMTRHLFRMSRALFGV